MNRAFAIVIERADENYAAYVPDLPGCVATGPTHQIVEERIRSAIAMHLAGMRADGLDVPEPSARVAYVKAAVA